MSETTLRLKSIADVAALNEWTRAIGNARNALQSFTEAQRANQTAGGTAGAGEAGTTAGEVGGSFTRPPAVAAQAAAQAPTAPPPPPPYAPPSPQQPAAPGENYAPDATRPPNSSVRNFIGPSTTRANWGANAAQSGMGYIAAAGAVATGLGLGASITGFLLNSGSVFMQLSQTVATLNQRFRDLGSSAATLGGRYGYTRAETSGMIEAYGAQVDSPGAADFQRALGFSRSYGLDPSATASSLGAMSRTRSGMPMSSRDMGLIAGHASVMGMGQGRMPEYLQGVQAQMQAQFEGRGYASLQSSLALQDLPGAVFGFGDARGQGQSGQALLQGLNQGMNSSGGKMLLMRAMGYGAKGSTMSYETMRTRQDMGVNDPNNVRDLFKYFTEHGLDRNKQIRALEEMGTGLPMWRISAMVDAQMKERSGGESLGDKLVANAKGKADDFYLQTAGVSDYAMEGQGKGGLGSSYKVKIEDEQMAAGQYVAQGMLDMNDSIINMAKGMKELLGVGDVGKTFTTMTGDIKALTEEFKKLAPAIHDALVAMTPGQMATSAAQTIGQQLDPLRPIYVINELTRWYNSDAGSAP